MYIGWASLGDFSTYCMYAKAYFNPLPHMQYLEHWIISINNSNFQINRKNICYNSIVLKILWKIEHLLLRSKCSNFHNILKNLTFQRRPKGLVWSKGLNAHAHMPSEARFLHFRPSLPLHPYFVYASSEGSGESAHLHRLV